MHDSPLLAIVPRSSKVISYSGTGKDKINYAFDKAFEGLEQTRAKVLMDRFGE